MECGRLSCAFGSDSLRVMPLFLHASSLPMPHRQALFVPSGSRRELATHLRWPSSFPLFTIIHKVHLALLRVTPQAPRNGGMFAALRAKEEIVHPAFFHHPSASSDPLRYTLSAAGCPHSASFTNSPLSGAVWVAAITATARFSRLCAPLTGQTRLRQLARPSP